MKMNMKLVVIILVAVFGGCTQAATKAEMKKSVVSADLPKQQTDENAANGLIASNGEGKLTCRYEKASGSNIRQRVCMSEEDRARVSESSKGFLNRLQQQAIPTSDALPTSGGN